MTRQQYDDYNLNMKSANNSKLTTLQIGAKLTSQEIEALNEYCERTGTKGKLVGELIRRELIRVGALNGTSDRNC